MTHPHDPSSQSPWEPELEALRKIFRDHYDAHLNNIAEQGVAENSDDDADLLFGEFMGDVSEVYAAQRAALAATPPTLTQPAAVTVEPEWLTALKVVYNAHLYARELDGGQDSLEGTYEWKGERQTAIAIVCDVLRAASVTVTPHATGATESPPQAGAANGPESTANGGA